MVKARDQITLTNVTEITDDNYTKVQTEAKIKVESDKITSAVSRISANETAISTLDNTCSFLYF